jgi:alpha-tubulin suppressor-like RCC1 family protein
MSQQVGDMEGTSTFAWGGNSSAQLGEGTTVHRAIPVPVVGLTNVRAVSAGEAYSLALLDDGTVRAWGKNGGQLGDGTTDFRSTPVTVVGLATVKNVAAGLIHNLATAGTLEIEVQTVLV